MTKSIFTVLLALLSRVVFSQSVSPQVVATAGDFFSSANGSISWTLGEVMTESYQSNTASLTQGFQQPFISSITAIEEIATEPILVYPNPAIDELYINFGAKNTPYTIELIDLQGRTVLSQNVSALEGNNLRTLSLRHFAPSVYLLRIQNQNSHYSFRIVKIN